jgi:O-antigen/teichoic acid export membrane protein
VTLATQKRLLGNTALLSASEAIVQVLNFGFAVLIARAYGPGVLGVYSYAMAIGALVCILVSLGTHAVVLRRASHEPVKATAATGALFGFQLCMAIALVLAVHGVARLLSPAPYVTWIVTVVAGFHVLTRVTSLLTLGFTARQQAGPAAAVPVARQGIALALAAAAMAFGAEAPLALVSMPLAALIVLIGMYAFAARRLGRPELRWRSVEIRRYLGEGGPHFGVVALNTLHTRLGILLLALLGGEIATGHFAAAERLVMAAGTVQAMFAAALLPIVTRLWKAERERFAELARRAARLVLLVTLPLATMLALFARDIVDLLYAGEFEDSAAVLAGIAWILVVRGLSQLLAAIATASDHQPILAKSRALGLVVLAAAGLVLIPRYGAQGLVAAMLAGETLALAMNYFLLRSAAVPMAGFAGGERVLLACIMAAGLAWLLSDAALALRLTAVVAGGSAALWLFGAIRDHDLRYLKSVLAARE